jgi:tetratricopeptide (TPR) repeat protein
VSARLSEFSRIKWERARDLRKRGEFLEAEVELKEALEEDPDHALLMASLAEVLRRQDRIAEARILVDSVLSRDPQDARALSVLGEILVREERLDEALQCFRQAAQKDPKPYLTLRIARTLKDMERLEAALEVLDSVLVGDRENPSFLKERALVLNRMGRGEEALDLYEKLAVQDPKDDFVRKEIYRLKGAGRPHEEMIQELQKVLSLPSRKDDPQLHGLLAQKLREGGRHGEAAQQFHEAWRLAPDNLYFLKQEGFCHYKQGDDDRALQALGEAFRRDPSDYRVRTTLEKIYSNQKDMPAFADLLEEVLKAHPHHVKLVGILRKVRKKTHGPPP